MKHWTLCFYSEPPSVPPPSCHTQWKHIWQAHVPTHKHMHMHAEQTGEHVRGGTRRRTQTHTPLLLASEWEMSFPEQDAGEGGVCCGD